MADYTTITLPQVTSLRDILGLYAWDAITSFCRHRICLGLQSGILKGSLLMIDSDGEYHFGEPIAPGPKKSGNSLPMMYINDKSFWVQTYLSYDIGFSESFMNQEFTCKPDLKRVLNLYVDNLGTMNERPSIAYKAGRLVNIIKNRLIAHNLGNSIANVAGYDASNDLYKAFLSEEMQYSCPIWDDEEGGVRGDLDGISSLDGLEKAQARKINHMLYQARLKPGQRLLEIGSGWGALAIAAANMGCSVDTLTLSVEQKQLADRRIREAGVEHLARVHLIDYRNMPPEFENAFNACISLEMLEAVGIEFMPAYIHAINWALKNEEATVVLSATTYPDVTFTKYQGNDFVRKYHWPHTIPPSATWLSQEFNRVLQKSQSKFSLARRLWNTLSSLFERVESTASKALDRSFD